MMLFSFRVPRDWNHKAKAREPRCGSHDSPELFAFGLLDFLLRSINLNFLIAFVIPGSPLGPPSNSGELCKGSAAPQAK